jgi:hypothetical protein
MTPPSPSMVLASDAIEPVEPMNKNKYKRVSECFKDITMDGKRGIGKATLEKLCFFLG